MCPAGESGQVRLKASGPRVVRSAAPRGRNESGRKAVRATRKRAPSRASMRILILKEGAEQGVDVVSAGLDEWWRCPDGGDGGRRSRCSKKAARATRRTVLGRALM